MTTGLTNLGNTCYMNSALQALFATKRFKNYVIFCRKDRRRRPLHSLLADLFAQMNASQPFISAKELKSELSKVNHRFADNHQEDAQEFLSALIEAIHDEANTATSSAKQAAESHSSDEAWRRYKLRENSALVCIFAGQCNYTMRCNRSHVIDCWEHFWLVHLDVPSKGAVDIQACFDRSVQEELIKDVTCKECNAKTVMKRQLVYTRLPIVFTIQLKIFDNKLRKLTDLNVNVNREFVVNGQPYALYALVCHHGSSIKSGHYTAYCAHNGVWYHCNDTSVSRLDSPPSKSEMQDTYIVFYEKRFG